jgi:hydroxymethylpyrimidine pyrophosphatase-like HAD family hydrolase
VTISHPRFLEFVAPGVSKGRAVRWLARRLGVPLAATLAIGDQWNDLEMLAEVGHGAAMPTAPLEVRAVARYIAPPLADEGVAALIEQLVLASPAAALRSARRLETDATTQRAVPA